jgi:hypothetical protein
MVAGTNPLIDAGIAPDDRVREGRVYFKSALGSEFFYVEMTPEAGRFVGVLPKPRLEAQTVTYYVQGISVGDEKSQTAEASAVVVEKAEDCGDRPVAALGPSDAVRVVSTTGGTGLPPGFAGVSSVVAGAPGIAVAGAAAGGGIGSTGLIVAGAVAAGVAVAIILSRNPESPSR